MIISVLSSSLVLIGVDSAEQTVIKGIVLALAVPASLDRSRIGIIK
ncbi:hypothetical protein ABTY63_27110 [Streptomyces solisilvae]